MKSKDENSKIQIKVAMIGGFFVLLGVIIPLIYNFLQDSNQEQVHLRDISSSIECKGDSQKCDNPHRETIEVKNKRKLHIQNMDHINHCSKVVIQTYINGKPQRFINSDETNPIEIGYLKKGTNTLEIDAKGIVGGCNRGRLNSWTMNLRLYTSKK